MKWMLIVLLVVGCSNTDDEWEAAARSINGELAALRPTVHAIAAYATRDDPSSVIAVVGMCSSMDPSLERIASTYLAFHGLDREPAGPHDYMTDVPRYARWLTENRYGMCQKDLWRCRDWCVRTWRGLADSVEVLRRHAAKNGTHVESLRDY